MLLRVPQDEAGVLVGRKEAEQIIEAVASRYGFRPRDFSIAWDDGAFDDARAEHRVTVRSADGREARTAIPHNALLQRNPWRYIRGVDAAFAALKRRDARRGL
jgi:hypothetical protein